MISRLNNDNKENNYPYPSNRNIAVSILAVLSGSMIRYSLVLASSLSVAGISGTSVGIVTQYGGICRLRLASLLGIASIDGTRVAIVAFHSGRDAFVAV